MKNNKLDILNNIGNTPLIKIGNIYAKLETTNLTGSVKDRMANYVVKKAEERGELKPGDKIIEVTSGNTGIALSMISALKGYEFIAIMPESMSLERRKMIEFFGGKIVLTPKKDDMAGAVKKYNELVRKNKNAWLPKQFENPDNIAALKNGLGKEIIKQMKGKIDAFVTGVGTGGTLIGVAKALKEAGSKAKIIAVEPAESAVLSGKKSGLHLIQGIGEGFIPKIVKDNLNLIDEVIAIKGQAAIKMKNKLAKEYGVLVGISSGANILAAQKLEKKYGYKRIVTILPDRGERYLSK
ncbi:MAG: cysteine synthase family protein [Candidatus Buchananbacteria bacterium]